ncbi:TonB-dependent receptor [Bacteroidota bacterium]|nr:TonB-dependent receptor [Bacteroidota bacterium]
MVWTITGFSQNLTIIDENNKPVIGASIFSDLSNYETTDKNGNVSLDKFSRSDTLTIKQYGFKEEKRPKSKLKNTLILLYDNELLDEVVISASKFSQKFREVPKKVTQINRSMIEFTNPMTSADLLERGGYVYIQKSQLGGGSPMIRGLSTNRLVLSVDGVRLNIALFRSGNIHNVISISPMNIENTEVIMGSTSVLYGSDAIGGVMNFYTKKAKLSNDSNPNIQININSRYSSALNEKMYHIDFNYGLEKIAFLSSFSKSDFDDLTMGIHGPSDYLRPNYVTQNSAGDDVLVTNSKPRVQRNTGYSQTNFMQKVLYEPNKNLSIDIGIHFSKTGNIPRYDRLIRTDENEGLYYSEWYYGPQEWLLINSQLTYIPKETKFYDELKFGSSFQRFNESRNSRRFSDSFLKSREEELDIFSLNLDFFKKISENSNITYGLEIIENKVGSFAKSVNISDLSETPISTRYPDNSSLNSLGLYINYKTKVIEDVFFQSGVRYSSTVLKSDLSQNNIYYDFMYENTTLENGAFVGGIGLSWVRNIYNNWKFNINTAFRSPNIDDLAKVFDSEPGSVVVPNPDLKPERSFGLEFGGYFRTKNNIELDFSSYVTYLYNSFIRDDFTLSNGVSEIIYDGELSQIQALQNSSKSFIYGIEFGINMFLNKNFRMKSQHNLIAGYELDDLPFGMPVRHIPPNYGNFHLIYNNGDFTIDTYLNYNSKISFNNLAESERAKPYMYASDENGNPYSPSWMTFNIRSKYSFSKMLSINFTVENITNKLYRPF